MNDDAYRALAHYTDNVQPVEERFRWLANLVDKEVRLLEMYANGVCLVGRTPSPYIGYPRIAAQILRLAADEVADGRLHIPADRPDLVDRVRRDAQRRLGQVTERLVPTKPTGR